MDMADLASLYAEHKDLSQDQQKKAGQAGGTTMAAKHKKFLAELIAMIDRKEIEPGVPSSFLNGEVYDELPEEGQSAVDYALLNLGEQLTHIEAFFRSKATPNASPELQSMIEHFWDMKSRLETKHGDVLKF